MPTPHTIHLIPNRGRDYDTAEAVLEHIKAGRDFIVRDMRSPWDGKPCNLGDLQRYGVMHARVQFNRLTETTTIHIPEIA